MPTKLFLIRHGTTDLNLEKRYCGFVDLGLNEQGKAQAGKLHQRLKEEKVFRVYSSDRKRAIETAKIIFKCIKIEKIPDLREIHFGVFEGLTYKEILRKHPEVYKKWLDDPFGINIPNGEDLTDFKKRILRAFKKIIRLNEDKTVAVICHGGVISMFMNYILESKDFWGQIPKSASLSVIEYRDAQPKIRLFNCTKHLDG